MLISELIDYIKAINPSVPYSNTVFIHWINDLEADIHTKIFLLDITDFEAHTAITESILADDAHTKVYWAWLNAMIALANKEMSEYNDQCEIFKGFWSDYCIWYAETVNPADGRAITEGYYLSAYGIAVKYGYTGTESEWNTATNAAKTAAEAAQEAAETAQGKAEDAQAAAETAAEQVTTDKVAAAASAQEAAGSAADAATAREALETAKQAVETAKASIEEDAATVAADKALVAADKAAVDEAKSSVDADKAAVAEDKAAAEAAKTDAESAKTNAETAKAAAETAQQAAETAKADAETAQEAAEAAQLAAETAKTTAEEKALAASTSETNAVASEANASDSEDAAAASAVAALISQQAAETAKAAAETAKAAAETAQELAEIAKQAAETAESNAETAEQNAITAQQAAETAQGLAETAKQGAEGAAAAALAAQAAAETAEINAKSAASDAEAWAVGQRNGVDVPNTDPTYHNNAKWYKEQASEIVGGDYPTKSEAQGYVSTHNAANDAHNTLFAGKVDKVTGKGLSTNDYTTTEKNKLAGIAAGAEVNVNPDWNATTGDAQILNLPSTFPPSTHDHTVSQITDFPTTMTPTSHNHTKSQITDFPTSMTPTAHSHPKSEITDFPTSMKNPSALTVGSKVYDGSAAKTINLSDLNGQAAITASGILKGAGNGSVGVATRGTDYSLLNAPVICTFPVSGWAQNATTSAWEQSVAVAGLLATDDKRTRVELVGSTDVAAQALIDAAYGMVKYAACNSNGYLYLRCDDGCPETAFSVAVIIGR